MSNCNSISFIKHLEHSLLIGGCTREHFAREVWELLHSGYYQDVHKDLRSCFARATDALIQTNLNPAEQQFFVDRAYILASLSSSISSKSGSGIYQTGHNSNNIVKWDTIISPASFRPTRNLAELDESASLEVVIRFLMEETPFVLRGGCSAWSALSEWRNPGFWFHNFASRYIPVEIGNYTDGLFTQGIVLFADFVQFIGTSQRPDQPQIYLAQYDLFERFSCLSEYISPTPDILHVIGTGIARNIFLGSAGTISMLHNDPYSNLFCQVVGAKFVRLHNPTDTEILYGAIGCTTTRLPDDLFAVSMQNLSLNFPSYPLAKLYECTLLPGDCVYIPRGWWHSLKSASVSCSIAHFMHHENLHDDFMNMS